MSGTSTLPSRELNAGTGPTWTLEDVGFSNEPFPSIVAPTGDEAYSGRGAGLG